MLSSAGAFLVEIAAFIGLMMLLARVLKGSGALIGIGVGLFIIFDFFWAIIILIVVEAARVSFGSLVYYQITIAGEFVNPAQFVGLVDTYITHQSTGAGLLGSATSGNVPITPSQFGITIPSLIAAGLLWSLIPLVAFLYLAIKKD